MFCGGSSWSGDFKRCGGRALKMKMKKNEWCTKIEESTLIDGSSLFILFFFIYF